MKSKENLIHLLKLVDDESKEIRENILAELEKYDSNLEQDIFEYSALMSEEKYQLLEPIFKVNRREWLKDNIHSWTELENEYEQLEKFMETISIFQLGFVEGKQQKALIDKLIREFKNLGTYTDELDLANFLFQEKNIQGSKEDYYNPLNSNVVNAMENKSGLPITLAILYMIIGYKLNFNISGCNFPGHFLAKIIQHDEIVLIDCFNGGRLIFEDELQKTAEGESLEAILKIVKMKTPVNSIVRRVLSNLVNAYEKAGETENKDLISSFLV